MINKAAINKLLEMPDERLIGMLRILLGGLGADLPLEKLDEKAMKRLRALLEAVTDEDLERIGVLTSVWQKGG